MDYRHTQTGHLAVLVLIWMALIGGIVAFLGGDETGVLAILGVSFFVVMVVVFWFSRLTVIVGAGEVRVHFGPGRPRRIIAVRNIIGIKQVRNKWQYGWGLRGIPGGWMFNVWGLDAVELDLANGKKFRIGTDEPEYLLAALSAHTALRPG